MLASSLIVATACATGEPVASSAPPVASSASAKPQPGGRVIEGNTTDPGTIQPVLSNDTASGRIIGLIYDPVLILDPKNGAPTPRLATFSASSDGLTYTFEMNSRANWSDGKPIVAQDYLTAVQAVGRSAKTVRKSNYQDVQGFNEYCGPAGTGKCTATASSISGIVIDGANPKKWTVKVTRVSCPAILDLNTVAPLPTHVFGRYLTGTSKPEDFDTAPENNAPTVFSGPFTFKEWRKGDQVILGRNQTYWQGAPNVDEYVYKIVADSVAITNGLKTGELTFGAIQPKDLADIQTVDGLRVSRYSQLGYTYIGWNTASPTAVGLADKRVRQALAYGLDMDLIIKAVVFGEGTKQVAHHVPVQWAYPTAPLEPYKYDKAKAEQLLKDAGWTKGADGILANAAGRKFSLAISFSQSSTPTATLAQVAVDQYRQLGIDAKARPEAFQGLVTKLTTGDKTVEATIIGWSLGGEPDPTAIWHSSQIPDPARSVTGFGFTYFKDAALDRSIEEGRNPSNGDCSIAARKQSYETFNRVLNENQPYNFGYSSNVLVVSQKTLMGFDPGSFGTTYNIHEWWIKK
jgi:peptide/nickel transport system substrate-binding protein